MHLQRFPCGGECFADINSLDSITGGSRDYSFADLQFSHCLKSYVHKYVRLLHCLLQNNYVINMCIHVLYVIILYAFFNEKNLSGIKKYNVVYKTLNVLTKLYLRFL